MVYPVWRQCDDQDVVVTTKRKGWGGFMFSQSKKLLSKLRGIHFCLFSF